MSIFKRSNSTPEQSENTSARVETRESDRSNKVSGLRNFFRGKIARILTALGLSGVVSHLGADMVHDKADKITGIEGRIATQELEVERTWDEVEQAAREVGIAINALVERNEEALGYMNESIEREKRELEIQHQERLREIEQMEIFAIEYTQWVEGLRANIDDVNWREDFIGFLGTAPARLYNLGISALVQSLEVAEMTSEAVEGVARNGMALYENTRYTVEQLRLEFEQKYHELDRKISNLEANFLRLKTLHERSIHLLEVGSLKALKLTNSALYWLPFLILLFISYKYMSKPVIDRLVARKLSIPDNVQLTVNIEELETNIEKLETHIKELEKRLKEAELANKAGSEAAAQAALDKLIAYMGGELDGEPASPRLAELKAALSRAQVGAEAGEAPDTAVDEEEALVAEVPATVTVEGEGK